MQRRAFIKSVGAAAGGVALGLKPSFADPADPTRTLIAHGSGLPRRILGRTGRAVSVVGYPGLALSKVPQDEANRALKSAHEGGINYFDVAPAYGDAEIKMGIAMQGMKRDDIFLACKTKQRDAAGARAELERSLTRLKTDHFDLYQLHVMSTPAEVKQAFGPGGVMETLVKARAEGKVRWLGFSAHTKEAALELLSRFKFDSVMYPVNFVEHYTHKFDPEVLSLCRREGAAVLAIKPISAGGWKPGEKKTRNGWWYRPLEDQTEINLAIRFSLSLDPVVSVLPTSFTDLAERSIIAGRAYSPATERDFSAMEAMAGRYIPLFRKKSTADAAPHTDYFTRIA
jgi:aryl-alcohol dehydrogenase-like predicted oxidoreductase